MSNTEQSLARKNAPDTYIYLKPIIFVNTLSRNINEAELIL